MEQFDKPLDTWVEEDVEVPVFQAIVDKRGNFKGVKQTTEKRKQKTMYSRATISKFSCAEGEHEWEMVDRHRHIAKCTNCPKNRFLRPIFETIKDRKIIDRDTGNILE